MDRARDNAAHTGNEPGALAHGDDASGGADHVDDITRAGSGANRVPMRIESANRNGNSGKQAQLLGPVRMERAGNLIASLVAANQFLSDTFQQRVNGNKEIFGWKSAERAIPHPFVAHGADGTWRLHWIGDAAEHSGNHVAMLEGGDKLRALIGIVPQPVQ